jgi:hypothetical protein
MGFTICTGERSIVPLFTIRAIRAAQTVIPSRAPGQRENMRCIRFSALSVLVFAGCATQVSTRHYTPPIPLVVKNEKTVPRPHELVWDDLVQDLSKKTSYTITDTDRDSRIIHLSFKSNSPSDYVDCGRIRHTYDEGANHETTEYAMAESARYKLPGGSRIPTPDRYFLVDHQSTLESRSEILVRPDHADPSRTVVSVNTRYALLVDLTSQAMAKQASGHTVSRGRAPIESFAYRFSTNSPASIIDAATSILYIHREASVLCSSKGRLETDILDVAR